MTHRPLRQAALAVALGLLAAAVPVAARQTPPEQEEPNPKKPVKVVPVDDPPEPTAPADQGGQPVEAGIAVVKLDDIVRAAATARNPKLKDFFAPFTVAFDRLTEAGGKVGRIVPVPLWWGRDRFPAQFGVSDLDAQNAPGEPRAVQLRRVRGVEPFEKLALAAVEELLKPIPPGTQPPPDEPSEPDKLAAAERLLTAVLFFHDSAREQNRRRGKNWAELKTNLYDKLTDVRVSRLRQAGRDRDWPRLRELSGRMIQLYRANPKVLEQVYAARLVEAEFLVRSDRVTDLERGTELLNEYEARFPNTKNESIGRIRAELAKKAKQFIAEAQAAGADKTRARNLLQIVEAIDPDNPAVRNLRQELRNMALYVGTRRLPDRMSPALARFDSEKQAVGLLFEGLYEAIPDEQVGVRYWPALAADRAGVGAGVRDVPLVGSAEWTGGDRGVFDAAAVGENIQSLRQKTHLWSADPGRWLDQPAYDPADPARVRVRLRLGHPDPRTLLTLKMLPARALLQEQKGIDDLGFARKPYGTGPFMLPPNYQPPAPGQAPREVVFEANPAYARRPGRMAQPYIKAIVFADVTGAPDLTTEFRQGRLHILTDVPTADLPKFQADNGLGGKVRVATAAVSRRIHLLAINHRRPHLQNPDVRRGISAAIDRDRVLNEVFRAGQEGVHRPLTGPFPPGAWTTPQTPGQTLSRPDVAQARLRQYLTSPGAVVGVALAYPADDPQAAEACRRIKAMVEGATATEDRKLSVNLTPLPPRDLLRRVEDLHDYDLAYLTFDYPDDWFPLALGSFLDPEAAGGGGRNYLGYLAPGTTPADDDERLGRQLDAVRVHRDPDELRRLGHEIHRQFNAAVPFVPLWHLDRHMVISTAVKLHFAGRPDEVPPRMLDQTTLFHSVGRWRVEEPR